MEKGRAARGVCAKASPAAIEGWRKRKTAPAPPAVRAPVFPHALPVTEGLKPAI